MAHTLYHNRIIHKNPYIFLTLLSSYGTITFTHVVRTSFHKELHYLGISAPNFATLSFTSANASVKVKTVCPCQIEDKFLGSLN